MKFVMYSVWGISKGGKQRGSGDVSLKGKILKGGREGRPIEDAIIAHPILYLRDGVGFFRTDLHGGRRAFSHVKARRIKYFLPYQIHKKEQVHKIWFCVPVTFKDKRRHVSALQQ